MSNDFLPDNYEAPKSNGAYMKLHKGENKFRILSKPVVGWVDWENNKPLRFTMDSKPSKPVDPKKPIKHFWAMVVWDYADSQIKILEITQVSIQKAIQSLSRDEDWGSPFGYDIKVTRTGDNMETEYTVKPVPQKPVSEEIHEAYMKKPIHLEELFKGGDPFEEKAGDGEPDDLPF